MNDAFYAAIFFLIFAAALALYGIAIAISGDIRLIPFRVRHSISGEDDVKRIGRVTICVALVVAVVAGVAAFLLH